MGQSRIVSDVLDRAARLLGVADISDRATRLLGRVTVDSAPTTAVTGTFYQATQPVSGTVAVSNATANPETGLAKDVTLTGRLPAALDADGGLKSHVQNFPATQPVSLATNAPDVTDRPARALGVVTSGLAPTGTVGSASGNIGTARVTGTSVVASTQLVAAPGAGLSIYVTDIVVSNSGSALTVIGLLPAAGTNVFDLACAANGGGGTVNLRTPWKLPAATALNYLSSVATTHFLTISYYVAV